MIYVVPPKHPDVTFEVFLGHIQGEEGRPWSPSELSAESSNPSVVSVKLDGTMGVLSFGSEGVGTVTVTAVNKETGKFQTAFGDMFVVAEEVPSFGGVLGVHGLRPQDRVVSKEGA